MEDKIRRIIEEPIKNSGYILDSVEYFKEGSVYYLRVIIDKEGIVTLDDCVEVTNLINPILDKEDPIEENYMLEVSSKERGNENE